MPEENLPLTIADLRKGTQLIDPQGYIIIVDGANAAGVCIVTPLDGSGRSVSISITDLNRERYKVHVRPEASDSINFYDIFDGLIIENKEGERLTIRELAECKVVVESEKGNSTVTSLDDLKKAEYYLLKPEQVPQERIIVLNLEHRDDPILAISSNVIEFGYNFLNVRTFSRIESQIKETGEFKLNYERIHNFCIYDSLEDAEKALLEKISQAPVKVDQDNPDGK